jgi:hypothetical protein
MASLRQVDWIRGDKMSSDTSSSQRQAKTLERIIGLPIEPRRFKKRSLVNGRYQVGATGRFGRGGGIRS